MGDALDRLAGPGCDLARRVDAALLAGGLPPGHAIVGLLRRLHALPGDAVDAIGALQPAPLRAAATAVRRQLSGYAHPAAALGVDVAWAGPTGERFDARRRSLAAYLGSAADPDADSMAGRLAATAGYLDDLADWAERARAELAGALAACLGSAAAVALVDTSGVEPAADLGARILAAADRSHTAGRAVAERWSGRLGELAYREPAEAGPSGRVLRLGD